VQKKQLVNTWKVLAIWKKNTSVILFKKNTSVILFLNFLMENPNFVSGYDIPYKSLKGQRNEK